MGPYVPFSNKWIFVIHSENDSDVVTLLLQKFNGETYGTQTINVDFLNSENPENLGKNFGDRIKKGITRSDFVIAIITENLLESIWANQEIGYSIGIEKDVICLIDKKLVGKGIGFIHSNIDSCVFQYGKTNFNKIEKFIIQRYGKKVSPKKMETDTQGEYNYD